MKKFVVFFLIQICVCVFLLNSQDFVYTNWNNGKELVDIAIYQTNSPENIIFTISEELQSGVFTAPYHYLDQLVDYLVSWTDNDYLKVKSIHDWIVCNISYDIEAYNNHEIKIQDPGVTLRFRSAVCGGYSTLFNYMLRRANFESYYVSGYTFGTGRHTIQPGGIYVRHAWNCVKINDIWYLIDTTWNAGYIQNNRFVFAYTTRFFLADPYTFIRTHYPSAPGFLLLNNYIGINEFRNMRR